MCSEGSKDTTIIGPTISNAHNMNRVITRVQLHASHITHSNEKRCELCNVEH